MAWDSCRRLFVWKGIILQIISEWNESWTARNSGQSKSHGVLKARYWGKKQRTVSREDHNVGFFECGYHSESENDFESLLEMFELLVSLDQWNMEEYTKVY